MSISPYFLERPAAELDAETLEAFERVYAEVVERGEGKEIQYALAAPRWQFLNYLCDTKSVVVHGSGNPHIELFEPRKSNDLAEFGNRRAVYAASDGIWAMYFAIVDREKVTSLSNACVSVVAEDGSKQGPFYFFSINGDALPYRPWRQGTIYILPRDTFEQQPQHVYGGVLIEVAQWASLVEVRPLARLTVEPDDFPFLSQIHPHDPKVLRERAARDPEGFPWMD